jgi:putative ABC transport system permease protein
VNPLPLVLAELRRNPLGCAAVVALIAVAVALGIGATVQERALRLASARAADRFDLVVGAPGSPTQLVLTTVYLQPAALELLPEETLSQLAREPGVASVAPVAVTDSHRGYTIVGTTGAFAGAGGVDEGRMFARAHEAVIGSAVQLALGGSILPAHGSPAENVLEAHEHDFALAIVGRLRATGTPWDRAILVPIEATWAMHEHDAAERSHAEDAALPWPPERWERVPAVVVKPRTVSDAYLLRAKYRGHGTVALFPAEVLNPLYRLLGDARDFVAWMALAFQALLVLAVLLVIVAVLASRRQSIGVLRAMGAPPAFVFLTVWLQAALLIAAGILVGAALGWGAGRALGAWLSASTGLTLDATPGVPEALLLLGLLLGGSLLAVLPSLAALRVSPVRLLRSV